MKLKEFLDSFNPDFVATYGNCELTIDGEHFDDWKSFLVPHIGEPLPNFYSLDLKFVKK